MLQKVDKSLLGLKKLIRAPENCGQLPPFKSKYPLHQPFETVILLSKIRKNFAPMKILLINGPNLNLLGTREPEIYGTQTFEVFFESLRAELPNVELEYFQSNHEGALLDKLHEAGFQADGIVFNAGALTHTSIALADAVAAISTPVIEVHISNVHRREPFRHHSFLSAHCVGSIVGLGLDGYRLAVEWFLRKG